MSIESRSHQYGNVFGQWQIKKMLGSGSGGKSAVFQLKRKGSDWDEYCALKVISLIEEQGSYEDYSPYRQNEYQEALQARKQAAITEVRLMAQLRGNTNIVDYLDYQFEEWSDDSGFGCDLLIRMEFLAGLRSDLRKGRIFDTREIVQIGKDIATALVLCHSKNILHRDIKPENIFYNANGNYKLGDFGISRIIDSTPDARASTGIGTPEYAAPEQDKGKYNLLVDIYSLGIVLYELANQSRLPFAASSYASPADIAKRMMGTPLPAPCNATAELSAIILKACAFTPSERYQTAQELLDALSNVNTTSETVRNSDPIADTPPKRADQLFEEKLKAFMTEVPEDPHVASGAADNPYLTAPALGDNSAPDGYATVPATIPADTASTGYETEPASKSPIELHDDYSANDLKQLRMCQEAAEQGDAEAQYELACHYKAGFGTLIEANPAEAAKWYQEAAARGHVDAQVELAYCYITGCGVNEDEKQGFFWFLEAAKKGSARAQYEYGRRSRHGMTDKEKRTWLKKAADQDYIPAILELAHYYEQLDKPAYDQVIIWYEKAVALGDVSAMISLAELYFNGAKNSYFDSDEITENYSRAYQLFDQAVERDTYQKGEALWYLGECYYCGRGVEQNDEAAVKCFSESLDNSYTRAILSLANCYYYGRGVPRDFEKAFSLYERSDSSFAKAMMAECYYLGHGVMQSFDKAVTICLSINNLEIYNHAKLVLGLCYIKGAGISKNISKGFNLINDCDLTSSHFLMRKHWGTLTCSTTDMPFCLNLKNEAHYELGQCYYEGIGTPQNGEKAAKHFREAAESVHSDARLMLAKCYRYAVGYDEPHPKAAMHWIIKADTAQANDLRDLWVQEMRQSSIPEEQYALGYYYSEMEDYDASADYYEKAAQSGLKNAQYKFGSILEHGKGRNLDLSCAATWYKLAADQGHTEATEALQSCLSKMSFFQRMKWKAANRS